MADSGKPESVEWYSAGKRGIIPIDEFHVSKNVQRRIRRKEFLVKVNSNFRSVVQACAKRPETWINDLIINSYDVLHQAGQAHSVEIYSKQQHLIGGLYGVSLGAAFFGESMFKKQKEMDKVALYYCHQILKSRGFILWDTQFYTNHLAQFGCTEITAEAYQTLLKKALGKEAQFLMCI